MKKLLLMSAVSVMMLAACSNDEEVPNVPTNEGTTSITLSLNSGGDGLNTRAARPVESSEAFNNVDEVIVRVFKADGTQVGTEQKLTWTAGPQQPGTPGTTDHKASQTLEFPKTSFEANTAYTIVAYGYNKKESNYTLTTNVNYAENAWSAAFANGKTTVEELFAGVTTSVTTGANKAFPVGTEVVMKRQIAGMLGYFKNIPVLYPNAQGGLTAVKTVKVYASNETKGFTFPSLEIVNRVNGTGATSTKTEILNFDLSALITEATAGIGKAYAAQVTAAGADPKKTFTLNEVTTGTSGNPAKVANSILGGKFLIPFAKTAGTTFTIELVAADNTVLKTWDVITNVAADGAAVGAKSYDVKRNYFYSIGKKLKAGEITTDPDPDKPIDLSKESIITITINDAWDVIYDLGIE